MASASVSATPPTLSIDDVGTVLLAPGRASSSPSTVTPELLGGGPLVRVPSGDRDRGRPVAATRAAQSPMVPPPRTSTGCGPDPAWPTPRTYGEGLAE